MPQFTPYQPRPISFLGLREVQGYRLKIYSIVYGGQALDQARFEAGLGEALRNLPEPAVTLERPGVGFVILHQGRTGSYVILCWWDRENELPMRIYIHDGAAWRIAAGSESICIWDLKVIWFEREAYVAIVLGSKEQSVEAYLSRHIEGEA